MPIRLLHTADWQLGKPFHQVPGDAGAVLREARYRAVERIAALARERAVDAVLVAGDLFDAWQMPDAAIRRCLQAMQGFAGPWILLPGNHDPLLAHGVWTRLAEQGPPEPVILAATPAPILLGHGRLAVLPAPLLARRSHDDLSAWMDAAATPADAIRVGLAHGTVLDRLPAGAEAHNPIAADRAARAGLAYLALGDWHGLLEVAPKTWYAGTPEPDGFKANAPGHALLVELDGAGAAPRVEPVATAGHRWHALALGLDAAADPAALVEAALAAIADPARALVELDLSGGIGLEARLAVDRVLERWQGRLLHLRLREQGLAILPDAADLAALADGGVIGRVAEKLRLQAATGGPEAADALLALRLLWRERQRAGAA